MRVVLAQVDCRLGEVDANVEAARRTIAAAAEQGADLVVFPELSLHGYALGKLHEDTSIPAGDERLAALSGIGPDVVVGFHEDGKVRRYNSALYLAGGRARHLHRKLYLPTYRDWEERKHASPGATLRAYDTDHGRMATLICNDAWQPMLPWLAAQDGAEVLLVPTNSAVGVAPGAVDTVEYWRDLLLFHARMQQCWVIFVNRVGDEAGVTFWGGSRVLDPWGETVFQAPQWEPSLGVVEIDLRAARRRRREMPLLQEARFELLSREIARLMADGGD